MTHTAVNVFVIDPTRYWWSGVASTACSASASPTASVHSTSPPRTTAAVIDATRRSACVVVTIARSSAASSLGAGKDSKRARNRVDRRVDVVIGDVEVRHRAELRRPYGRREEHAFLLH